MKYIFIIFIVILKTSIYAQNPCEKRHLSAYEKKDNLKELENILFNYYDRHTTSLEKINDYKTKYTIEYYKILKDTSEFNVSTQLAKMEQIISDYSCKISLFIAQEANERKLFYIYLNDYRTKKDPLTFFMKEDELIRKRDEKIKEEIQNYYQKVLHKKVIYKTKLKSYKGNKITFEDLQDSISSADIPRLRDCLKKKKECKENSGYFVAENCICKKKNIVKEAKQNPILEKLAALNSNNTFKINTNTANKGRDLVLSIGSNELEYSQKETLIGKGIIKKGYANGEYDVPDNLKKIVNQACLLISKGIQEKGLPASAVRVYIVGLADSTAIKGFIPYFGYKNISISEPVLMRGVNYKDYVLIKNIQNKNDCGIFGKETFIFNSTNPDQNKITNNIQLAYLRAYPLKIIIENHFPEIGDNISIFPVETLKSDLKGTDRRIQVYIYIKNLLQMQAEQDFIVPDVWVERMKSCSIK